MGKIIIYIKICFQSDTGGVNCQVCLPHLVVKDITLCQLMAEETNAPNWEVFNAGIGIEETMESFLGLIIHRVTQYEKNTNTQVFTAERKSIALENPKQKATMEKLDSNNQ